jgi:hypothetical protein
MYFKMQKIKYQMCRVAFCFNRVIELNQKMLILSRFVAENVLFFYIIMTIELFIEYFCNIMLCCLWRFNDNNVCYLLRKCLCLDIVLYLLFKGDTPLQIAASGGKTDVVELLLKSGASPSVVDSQIIKPSIKLKQSNIKLLNWIRKCWIY